MSSQQSAVSSRRGAVRFSLGPAAARRPLLVWVGALAAALLLFGLFVAALGQEPVAVLSAVAVPADAAAAPGCRRQAIGPVVFDVPSVTIRPQFRLNGQPFPAGGAAVITLWASEPSRLFDGPQLSLGLTSDPPEAVRVIPGLQMRGECRLGLVDSFERALVERVVQLRDTPGIQRVELEALPAGSARVLVTVQGAPLPEGSLLISATGGGNGSSFAIWEGKAEIGPMLAGTYDLEVRRPGFPSHRVAGCELVPGGPPLVIDLER